MTSDILAAEDRRPCDDDERGLREAAADRLAEWLAEHLPGVTVTAEQQRLLGMPIVVSPNLPPNTVFVAPRPATAFLPPGTDYHASPIGFDVGRNAAAIVIRVPGRPDAHHHLVITDEASAPHRPVSRRQHPRISAMHSAYARRRRSR